MVGIQRGLLPCLALISIFLVQTRTAHSFEAQFGVSPDNNQDLLFSVLKNAKKSLLINIYEFANPTVAEEVIKKIQEGVCTHILIEGDPVGGIGQESVQLLETITTAMQVAQTLPSAGKRSRNEFEGKACHQALILPPQKDLSAGIKKRFRFNHAKYVVADGETSLISSENFSANGHPNPGRKGTRGWDIVIEGSELAQQLTQLFESDTSLELPDVKSLDLALIAKMKEKWNVQKAEPSADVRLESEKQPANLGPTNHSIPSLEPAASEGDLVRKTPTRPKGTGNVEKATLITSPNSAPALRQIISESQRRIDLNFMSLPKDSYILGTLVEAARRGVNTRLLLNDGKSFGANGKGKPILAAADAQKRPSWQPKIDPQVLTAQFALRLAHCDHLPLDARIIDTRAAEITYIHNKGMIVDEEKVLVSSINGTQNSMDNNREVAVLVQSPDAARYYGEFFELDWSRSPAMSISEDLVKYPCHHELVQPAAAGPEGFFPVPDLMGAK